MSSVGDVIWFLLCLRMIAGCCNCTRCFIELGCKLIDRYYDRQIRLTMIAPSRPDKIIPPEKYVVVINPPNCPVSIGLPEEYSNV